MTTTYFGEEIEHESELGRLQALERVYDPASRRLLDEVVEVAPGWRCLELGAGAGSIARWLAERVGPEGRVVAVDLNCRFLADLPPNVDVVEGDLTTIPFDTSAFDLVHHRAVLAYVADREEILTRAVGSLIPGGWLLAEEPIFPGAETEALILGDTDDRVVRRALGALTGLLDASGATRHFGLRLPSLLEECGLAGVDHQGVTYIARGGDARSDYIWPTLAFLKPFLVDSGEIDADGVDRAVRRLRDPQLSTITPTLVSAWGQRVPSGKQDDHHRPDGGDGGRGSDGPEIGEPGRGPRGAAAGAASGSLPAADGEHERTEEHDHQPDERS